MIPFRIAYLVSHPIPYLSPLFKEIAADPRLELTVFYCSRQGLRPMQDRRFSCRIQWDVPLLMGYRYRFLDNHSPLPNIFRPPLGLLNLGVVSMLSPRHYDAVIIHGWHYATYWLAYITALARKLPFFIRAEPPLIQEKQKAWWKIRAKKLLLQPLFQRSAGCLAIGSENAGFFSYYGVPAAKIFLGALCR